jgi:glycerol-3-phosphate dehydrogenase subunit B
VPIREDVVVVGGGVAGAATAVSAARTGASVRLVTHKKSTLRHASGLIDVLGYVPGDDKPVVYPYSALSKLPDDHPYSVVGESAVREGLTLFDDMVGDAYEGGHTAKNALVATHGGTVKPTARYPKSAAPGLASRTRDTLLVGFRSLPDFDASVAADHLAAAGAPYAVEGVQIDFPGDFRADAKVTRYAKALDRNEELSAFGKQRSAREALAEAVRPHLDGAERVGFPALLGDESADRVRADLSDLLGADVFEIPMGPPSLPGLRLEDLLFDAMDEAGVRISAGNPVVGYERVEGDSDRVASVTVDRNGQRVQLHADEFVLATGGLVGKGIDSDREGVSEPVFDCHVPHPSDRYDWWDGDAFGDHPFAAFGVVPDDQLRPTDADGRPEFANLRAAGGVVGGADFAAEKSGSGVSLATGYLAGRNAGEAI